jgi:hypothetical protein
MFRVSRRERECCKVIHSFKRQTARAGFEATREAGIFIRAHAHPLTILTPLTISN